MKIIKLISENVKGLKAIEIVPDEHFQLIGGKNGQGKTSVLDSIWLAVGGKEAAKAVEKPIRDGQESAFVTVDLGDIQVTRKWKGDKTALEVVSKEGAKFPSPQTMLDDLIGKLSFDPLSFANMEDKKQAKTLQELVGIDFSPLDAKRKMIYDDRTETNRELEKLKALKSKTIKPKDAPEKETSASEVLQELREAQDIQKLNDRKRKEEEDAWTTVSKSETEIISIQKHIKELQEQLEVKKWQHDSLVENAESLSTATEQLVDPDLSIIQTKLEQVEQLNQQYREAQAYEKVAHDFNLCLTESLDFTRQIEEIDKTKKETLEAAVFPIAGLSFDENGVTFHNIPFKDCSAAERLKVSMAMAMALNPKLRVIRILDGSLLDSDNLALIHEMAKEKDYQVWIEVVDSTGTVGINIEAGLVKEVVAV